MIAPDTIEALSYWVSPDHQQRGAEVGTIVPNWADFGIRHNNTAVDVLCAVCGQEGAECDVGPRIFYRENGLVCAHCARKHCAELVWYIDLLLAVAYEHPIPEDVKDGLRAGQPRPFAFDAL